MKIKSVGVVFVYVSDMARARNFYEHVLGLGKPKVESADWVEYELPGATFALHKREHSSDVDVAVTPVRDRGTRVCLEVDDVLEARKFLQDEGCHITVEPRQEHGYRLLEFEDLDGNPVRLIEYMLS